MGPIKPGDRFLMVREDYRGNTEKHRDWITVIKVGRRWADFQIDERSWRQKDHRFDMETMRVDGGNFTSPGRVYASEEEFEAEGRRQAVWKEFQNKFKWAGPPPKVTTIDILKAADALGFRLKEE